MQFPELFGFVVKEFKGIGHGSPCLKITNVLKLITCMSTPHFTLPPFDPPKPETLKIAHAVIAAKGQIKLTAEQAYNLARDTIGLSKVHMGVTHFLEQLETFEAEKARQRDERRQSGDSQSE